MPVKATNKRKPQQGRHKTTKTKCSICGTYYQTVYMFIYGRLQKVNKACPECIKNINLEVIKMDCKKCGTQLRIMSDEKEFYRYCPACGLRYEIEEKTHKGIKETL